MSAYSDEPAAEFKALVAEKDWDNVILYVIDGGQQTRAVHKACEEHAHLQEVFDFMLPSCTVYDGTELPPTAKSRVSHLHCSCFSVRCPDVLSLFAAGAALPGADVIGRAHNHRQGPDGAWDAD